MPARSSVLHACLGYRDPLVWRHRPEVNSQSGATLKAEFQRWLASGEAGLLFTERNARGPLATALAGFAAHGVFIGEVRLYAATEADGDVAARLAATVRLLPKAFPNVAVTPVELGPARVYEYEGAFAALAREWRDCEADHHVLLGPGTPQLNAALAFRAAGSGLALWQVTTPSLGARLESVGDERFLRRVVFGKGALPPVYNPESAEDLRARSAEAEIERIAADPPGEGSLDYRAAIAEYERQLWAAAVGCELRAAREAGRKPSKDNVGALLGCSGANVRKRFSSFDLPWPE